MKIKYLGTITHKGGFLSMDIIPSPPPLLMIKKNFNITTWMITLLSDTLLLHSFLLLCLMIQYKVGWSQRWYYY